MILLVAQTAALPLEAAITEGVRGGVFPGAVVVVGTPDSILYSRGFGHFTWKSTSPAPHPDSTLYDLASLTKVVATTPAAMLLVERGQLDLERPVAAYLPDFQGPGKERVTVRHLLAHNSGFRPSLRLDRLAQNAADARRLVMEEPLRWRVGGQVVYSDLNAILLGWVIERVTGQPLDRFVGANLFRPLGMAQTAYQPARALAGRIAPVGLWRGHAVGGEVHDQNAVRLGGVAGHAGLFSTGYDLARYAQMFLRQGTLGSGVQLFGPELVDRFTRRGAGNRALGWEMRDTTSADNTGTRLTSRTYGHTGFTGTSLWIDPDRGLFVILLTNRVFAPRGARSISKLKAIRGQVADAATVLAEQACRAGRAPSMARTPC